MSKEQKKPKRKKYPSDISQNGWNNLKKELPQSQSGGPKGGRPTSEMREIINAIFYVLKTGCSWRSLPHDFPNWSTVYGFYSRWSKDGTWERIHTRFVKKIRSQIQFRNKRPTAAIIDSQSVKTSSCGGDERGFDGGKQIKGRKRFILTDTQGLLLAVWVCAASVSEQAGARKLLTYIKSKKHLKRLCSKIQLVWADGGYQGENLENWVKTIWNWIWAVVSKPPDQKGFQVLPRRWVVERTFAWLAQSRRLNRDYEKLAQNSQAFCYIAMIRIMANRF